jgi:plastocyanin
MSRQHLLGSCLVALLLSVAAWFGSAGPIQAADPIIPVRDLAFPLEVGIGVGDTVTWLNEEPLIPHDMISGLAGQPGAGQLFASPMLQPGESFSFTFAEPGIYDYYCSIHPNMRGAVVARAGSAGQAPTSLASTLLAAPVAQPSGATVVASGLLNPRGFTFAPDGALVVAESGSPPPGFQPVGLPPPPDFFPGATKTGRVSRVNLATGERTTLADGLPSGAMFFGDTLGPSAVAYLGSDLYVAIAAGPVHGWPFFPSGVYRVQPDGTVRMVGNTDAFNLRNPVAFVPPDEEISNPYDMLAADGALYLTDGNVNQIYRIVPGAPAPVSRLADLSVGHGVTTGLGRAPDGALVTAELTAAPFPQGAGRILRVGLDGQVGELSRGTTAATGVALAGDGTVYVVEHSVSLGQPPFLAPGTGRVARLQGDGALETVLDGLTFPTMARIGPDGALYVANFSVAGNDGEGQILRLGVGAN